jgi:hypothetical protein
MPNLLRQFATTQPYIPQPFQFDDVISSSLYHFLDLPLCGPIFYDRIIRFELTGVIDSDPVLITLGVMQPDNLLTRLITKVLSHAL